MKFQKILDNLKPGKVDIGWGIEQDNARFIFDEPEPLFKSRSKPLSNRSVQACPSVNGLESEYYVIKSPFDFEVKCLKENNQYRLFLSEANTRVDSEILQKIMSLSGPNLWREPDCPILQLNLPYFFLSDQECYMSVIAPYMSKNIVEWPGVFVGGKIPIHIWPRLLNWAFEWTDLSKSLKIKRGHPLMYVHFNTKHLVTRPNVFELEHTDALKEYQNGHKQAPKYVSNTFSLFENAAKRRPKKLLVKKKY